MIAMKQNADEKSLLARDRAIISAEKDRLEDLGKLKIDRVLLLSLTGWLFALGIVIYVKMIV